MSQLQHLVENSALSAQDKDMWLRTLEMLDDEQAQAIYAAVGNDPHELDTFTRNVKLKQIAFASGDEALLDQILQEEEDELLKA